MTTVIFREADSSVNVARQVAAWTRQRARHWSKVKAVRLTSLTVAAAVIVVVAVTASVQTILKNPLTAAPPNAAIDLERSVQAPAAAELSTVLAGLSRPEPSFPLQEEPAAAADKALAKVDESVPAQDYSQAPAPAKRDLSYLHYYIYSELPPTEKPADIVLGSLQDMPAGSSVEEIKHAAEAFGIDFTFMKAIAKIESDFDPKQRTGSYIGLFQLSKYEFRSYGSGDILTARDNAITAAYKFLAEAALFEWHTRKKPTFIDLYMIHQQGWQGAAEHVAHPERIAWKSMCATDEGREKGEKWCKRAVWGNTLPDVKHVWKSVDKLTSGAFVTMWRQRIEQLYSRYSQAALTEKH
jgi:hypothetical protein